jgi:hypothetical protein
MASIFQSGNHPQEDLAKSGYKKKRKFKSLIIVSISLAEE